MRVCYNEDRKTDTIVVIENRVLPALANLSNSSVSYASRALEEIVLGLVSRYWLSLLRVWSGVIRYGCIKFLSEGARSCAGPSEGSTTKPAARARRAG